MTDVVVAAGGAAWESEVLHEIEVATSLRLTRRCVDVAELLAVAPQAADVAIVAAELSGLDADTVFRLERSGVRVIGLGADERCRALGIALRGEPGALERSAAEAGRTPTTPERSSGREGGTTVAVWGSGGAPGRSTIATSLAASFAHLGSDTVLVDADTYGGSIAQMLAMLDDVSGLMAACRAANRGQADAVTDHLLQIEPRLRLLSGIPRADLWPQVRPGALDLVLHRLRAEVDVLVADCAAPLEPGGEARSAGRNQVTRQLLSSADAVLVVGRADPVGLSRLVRAVHDVSDVSEVEPVVVVNLMRSSLGWSEREVAGTLARLTGVDRVTFVPADTAALDLAVMRGRLPREVAPSSGFVSAVDDLAGTLTPVVPSSLSS